MLNYYGTLVQITEVGGSIHHLPLGSFYLSQIDGGAPTIGDQINHLYQATIFPNLKSFSISKQEYTHLSKLLQLNINYDCPIPVKVIQ